MRNIVAFALLFVFSVTDFGQKVTLQTRKVKPKPVVKTQKIKPKTAAKTEKTKPPAEKTKPKVAVKKQEIKPKTEVKPKADAKPKVEAKSKAETKVKTKIETKPEITTLEAKTADGKDITLKSNGTWAYKKPEPTPKPSPVAKSTPIATPVTIAKTTPTPKPEAKQSPAPIAKPSPVAKTKPTPSQCDLALQDAPLIRGLRLGMTRAEADGIIPSDRITIVDSSDIVSYPQYSRARGFENVYQISAQFNENKLSALEIVYDPDDVKWKSAKDFAESLSTSLKLSPQFWKYNAKNPSSAQMQCREFSIKIDSTANEISLQKITPEQKTAQENNAEKKVFKP